MVINDISLVSAEALQSLPAEKVTTSLFHGSFLDLDLKTRVTSVIEDCSVLRFRGCMQGLVEAVGVSNYGPQQLNKIAKYLGARDVPLITAQVCFICAKDHDLIQCFASIWLCITILYKILP